MHFLTKNRNIVLKIISLLFIFNTTVWADFSYIERDSHVDKVYLGDSSTEDKSSTRTEVSLDSFGGISVTIVLIMTSFLGAFFVRDELGNI